MDYLRQYDSRVPVIRNVFNSRLRPMIGIIFEIDGFKFYAPLSSPKQKHLKMKTNQDFIKIDHGNFGVINLNNMVPILDHYAQRIDISNYPISHKQDEAYVNLLKNQMKWCNTHKETIRLKASKLFESIKKGYANEKLKARCCDYPLLIEKSIAYKSKNKIEETK
jgi:protein AbiQ